MIRRVVRVSGAVIAAMVLLLIVDWGVAAFRKAKDDRLVKELQEKVKNDASLAPKLAAEQKRVTDYRKARKRRDTWAGNVLIAAAVVFLVYARRGQPRRVPPARRGSETLRKTPRGSNQSRDRVDRRKRLSHIGAQALASWWGRRFRLPTDPDLSHGRDGVVSIDLAFVDDTVAKLGTSGEMAIPLLQAIQTHYRYLPDEALRRLCEITDITPAQVAGTSSFYGQFRRSPVGEHIVKVCHGTACHVAGARQITDELQRYLDIPEGQDTDASRQFTLEEVACLGCCSLAPVLMVDEQTAGRLTPNTAPRALKPFEKEPA